MNASQAQKREEKAQHLPVIQVAEDRFYVESEKSKIAYLISTNGSITCTCADFVKNSKTDPDFQCKHILALMHTEAADRLQTGFLDRKKPRLNPEFVKTIDGKDFVTYQGLLDLAHQKGLIRISTQVLQYPLPDNGNAAVVQAVAETKTGEMFSDVGDANPNNCNSKVARHIIRMASTRAKARTLRDLTNVGMTALEELGDLDEIIGENGPSTPARRSTPRTSPGTAKVTPVPRKSKEQTEADQGSKGNAENQAQSPVPNPDNQPQQTNPDKAPVKQPTMSEAQKRAIANLSRRRNIPEAELHKMALDAYGVELEYISSSDAATFIRQLQQSA